MDDLFDTYGVLEETTQKCTKPVYSVLPSVRIAQEEINHFISKGGIAYSDEVMLGLALGKISNSAKVISDNLYIPTSEKGKELRKKVLPEEEVLERLLSAGIPLAKSIVVNSKQELKQVESLKFPLVAKVIGILHKTEVGGVILNIGNYDELLIAFDKILSIEGSKGMFLQEMIQGTEIYLGGKKHPEIGYSVHAGLGGIFVELIGDVASCLAPVNINEARNMLSSLKAQKIFKGFRNLPPVDFETFAQMIVTFSLIFNRFPDIDEIDLNPLIATGSSIVAVDARIIIS
jgi:acetyltransferase